MKQWVCVLVAAAAAVLGAGTVSNGATIVALTPDTDTDGVGDSDDNVIHVSNADQADLDGDGLGDAGDPAPSDTDADADAWLDGADPDPQSAAVTGPHTFSLGGPYLINPSDTLVLDVDFGPVSQLVALEFDLGDDGGVDGFASLGSPGTDVEIPASYFTDAAWDLNTPGTYFLSADLHRHAGFATDSTTVTVVPEPSATALLAVGGVALLPVTGRRRRDPGGAR